MSNTPTPPNSVVSEAMIERLRQILKRATPLPWAWEQCGEKEDAPVVGVIVDRENQPLAGCIECYNEDGTERGYYRETIAYEWQHCDGHSASANADFVVEAVNALPALLDEIERLQSANTTGSDELVALAASAMQNVELSDGEGNTYRLFDLLDFSGENKAVMVTRQLAQAALSLATTPTDGELYT